MPDGAMSPMWNTDTPWLDLAVVMTLFAVGNILFGHFEEHKPKPLRLLKMVLVAALILTLSALGLRWAAYTVIGIFGLAAAYVHLRWLPRHGINGWTGEPKEKYYELLKVRPKDRGASP